MCHEGKIAHPYYANQTWSILGKCTGSIHYCVALITNFALIEVQWNLQIKDVLGQGVLSFIERFPLYGG